ncbi:hypothetical protein [Bradyrhizobium sp. USDA 10063]
MKGRRAQWQNIVQANLLAADCEPIGEGYLRDFRIRLTVTPTAMRFRWRRSSTFLRNGPERHEWLSAQD